MFKKWFEEVKKYDDAIQQIDTNVVCEQCEHESEIAECNLIQLLKQKQTYKSELEKEIHNMKLNVSNIRKFLKALYCNGIFAICSNNLCHYREKDFDFYYDMYDFPLRIESSLQLLTLEDICNMQNELQLLKQRRNIINKKEETIALLKKEIVEIKMQLGIE